MIFNSECKYVQSIHVFRSLSTKCQIINGDEKLSELNLSPVNTFNNDKVITTSPRTRKNKRQSTICNLETECDNNVVIDPDHKANENIEVGKEKLNRKRRKNRYKSYIILLEY